MRGAGIDLVYAFPFQRVHDLDQCAGRVYLVVDDDCSTAAHLADDIHQLRLVEIALAPLLDDGQRRAQRFREGPGPLGEAKIRDHDRVFEALVDEVPRQNLHRGQLVDRDVEEALDLALMEIHGQNSVGPRHGDHVGDQASRDGHTGLVLLVRAAVGVERDHGRDPAGAGPFERVDHDQQLHDRLVDGMGRWLDQEDVLFADVVEDLDEDVLVRELEDLGLARLDP